MNELISQLKAIKSALKELRAELNDKLMEDHDYAEFSATLADDRECLQAHRNKLITESVELSAAVKRIVDKKNELRILKQSIRDSVMIVDKVSKEQIVMDLRF